MLKKTLKYLYKFLLICIDDFKRTYWYQYFPRLPEGINMNANDICNSKCVMCNIWKQKKDYEFSPEELEKALKNPLFRKVKFVGLTGGEPTMREDLIGLYEACINALPSLTNLSIITNGIKEKMALAKIIEIDALCKERGIKFTTMVSLDGVGAIHDINRGRDGNFETSTWLIEQLKAKGIPVSFGCTVTKHNVWHIQELEKWAEVNNVPGRFRVAEFIKRLYITKTSNAEEIRNFNEEETYFLQNFFHKYATNYNLPEAIRRNYKSIFNVLSGKKRSMACPHHDRAVQMDSRGVLHYCAPQSESIGSAIKHSALALWKSNLKERRRIIANECDSCIHDYIASITVKEFLTNLNYLFWARFWERYEWHQLKIVLLSPIVLLGYGFSSLRSIGKKTVMITGWYGTETTGDKAILAGILMDYKSKYKNVEFIIASMFPFVTEKTLKELDIKAKIVDTKSASFVKGIIACDEVAFGGGPLMDLEALALSYYAFKLVNLKGGKSTIFGCGLGPLLQDRYIQLVTKLVNMSKKVYVRDSKSVVWVKQHTKKGNTVKNIGDPAGHYIKFLASKENTLIEKKNQISCFLRKWTPEYAGNQSKKEYEQTKTAFEFGIAQVIKKHCNIHKNAEVVLYPMHTFHLGGDDREFNRYFVNTYLSDLKDRMRVFPYNSTVDVVIEGMRSSQLNICMRFHSVLIAEELHTNFIAIDYTNGGKIKALLTDKGKLDRLLSINQIMEESYQL
jgi:MoaA/NifB/PqqE/SkfB family radical SAM enzyme/polysaccharide pyruvyl transferase WcaK-like protein